MQTGYCTYGGFTKVTMAFWWLAKGSPGDYGEVYYSVDNGPWILTTNTEGATKYSNMPVWKYTRIESPAFLNVGNLRFAFKWTNDGINTSDELPFSIDDIAIVAEYPDPSPSSPGAIVANFILPNSVCHEDVNNTQLDFYITVNDTMCAGSYQIEISDSNCNFTN